MLKIPLLILCGGLGTRLSEVTKDTPKILVDINGKTFLEIQFEFYYKQGFREFYYLTGFGHEQIADKLSKIVKNNATINILNEGEKRLGTGGCLARNVSKLPKKFFLTYGDTLLNCQFEQLDKLFEQSEKNILTIYKNENKFDESNIDFDEKNKKILSYKKKNNAYCKYIDYGISGWQKSFIADFVPGQMKFDLQHYIQTAISLDKLEPFISSERFYEIGRPETLKDFKDIYELFI
tara:strand:- start:1523 stop:2230 length:708 start_codon:yes stop_codon:yes gene_type:complete